MTEWKMGMLAKSKAGHDKNNVYIVIGEEDRYVYLADGEVRTWEKPKKKEKETCPANRQVLRAGRER